MPSACDSCLKPGHCCQVIALNSGEWPKEPFDQTVESVTKLLKANPQWDIHGDLVSLDFQPTHVSEEGVWFFDCRALHEGRCSIYHRRPALCKSYEPLGDKLCYHHDEATAHLRPVPSRRGTDLDLKHDSIEDIKWKVSGDP